MSLIATRIGMLSGEGSPNYLRGAAGIGVHTIGSSVYAFVASAYDDALSIQDVSDPSNSSHVGMIRGAGRPNYLDAPQKAVFTVIDGTNLVFLPAYADDALSIINVDNPSVPSLEGEIHKRRKSPLLARANDVKVATIGGTEYAFVAAVGDDALTIIDVSDPIRPSRETDIHGAGAPNYLDSPASVDLFTIGSTLYAFVTAIVDDALVIIDVSDPTNVALESVIRGAGSPNYLNAAHSVKVASVGGVEYAFVVAAQENALTIFDVSTPAVPVHVGEITGSGSPNYLSGVHCVDVIAINGTTYAIVTSYLDDSLSIFDVSTPSSPTLESVVHGAGSPNYLNYAYGVKVFWIDSTPYAFVVARSDNALTIWELAVQ